MDSTSAEARPHEAIADCTLDDSGFTYTMSLIQGKYKMTVLYTLMRFGVVRFNEMRRYIGRITYKTLSSTLKALEADGLVDRREYPQVPPKVEYRLTERGRSLIPILDQLCDWGERHRPAKTCPAVTETAVEEAKDALSVKSHGRRLRTPDAQ